MRAFSFYASPFRGGSCHVVALESKLPRNGSGAYSLPSGNPVVTGTTVSSTTMNSTLTDVANALTGSLAADGQTAMSGNLQMGGNRVTGAGNAINSTDLASYGQITALVPSGVIFDFAGTAVPAGFLACNGAAVSRTTYAALFAAVGTTWGAGDGSTTFNVPDLRRRTTIGVGGVAVSGPANTLGAVGGEEAHALTVAELAAHNHGVTDPGHAHTLTDPGHSHIWGTNTQASAAGTGNLGSFGNSSTSPTSTATTGITMANATTGITTNNNGSGTAHNVMQPSAVVNKIIKT